ncbi:MAG: bifunctional adenosylcobinamide kinase/adenosylcobinamide-phosphate guanylyltransferase [Limnochordia bacterium]
MRKWSSRIQRHRASRPPSWETVEAPLGLVDEIRKRQDRGAILVDCLDGLPVELAPAR